MARGRKKVDERGLTTGQAVFVASWTGDLAASARVAGVQPNTARKWLAQNPAVKQAIKDRGEELEKDQVSSATHVLRVLTQILDDPYAPNMERIQAADKILKAHGAYIQKIEHVGPNPWLQALEMFAERDRKHGHG